jgi:hypothetical protein
MRGGTFESREDADGAAVANGLCAGADIGRCLHREHSPATAAAEVEFHPLNFEPASLGNDYGEKDDQKWERRDPKDCEQHEIVRIRCWPPGVQPEERHDCEE